MADGPGGLTPDTAGFTENQEKEGYILRAGVGAPAEGTTLAMIGGETGAAASERPSFRERFAAWWHGYELAAAPPPSPSRTAQRPTAAASPPAATTRAEALQRIWGEGFVSPGNPEAIIELVKPLRLNPEISLLDLGAGLGGPDREIVKAFGVWTTGLEAERDFVERGSEQATCAGLANKATLNVFDPETAELPERKYDRVFSKELLHTVTDKPRLVAQIARTLRNKGELLFTDYVIGTSAGAVRRVAEWASGEAGPRHPVPAEALVDMLKTAGLDVRIAEDVTPAYLRQATLGLARIEASLAAFAGQAPANARSMLARELAVWLRRIELLRDGSLQVHRFHALKTGNGKLMSNW